MSQLLKRRWTTEYEGLAKRDRRSCDYEAYVPDPLMTRVFRFDGLVAAAVVDAEAAIIKLNHEAAALVDTEALARILLRAEAVGSSKIEGLEIGVRRLLHAEVQRKERDVEFTSSADSSVSNRAESDRRFSEDVTAEEVLGNIDAMAAATALAVGEEITVDLLLEIHRKLLSGSRLAHFGGVVRIEQNWIGGSSYNPCAAAFVPPPPELVLALLEDLCAFSSTDHLPAVAQAAIAHAQFETIHPFVDGNGRTGRALIHLILKRRDLAPRIVPPVSLILATWANQYISALIDFRYQGSSASMSADAGANQWIAQFAEACVRAVADANAFENKAHELQRAWRTRTPIRKNSAADLLLRALPGAPVLTVNSAAMLIGRSFTATNSGLAQLVESGILQQVNVGRRNRAYEAPEIIAAFTDLERQLASPQGNTRVSKPERRVPQRRAAQLAP